MGMHRSLVSIIHLVCVVSGFRSRSSSRQPSSPSSPLADIGCLGQPCAAGKPSKTLASLLLPSYPGVALRHAGFGLTRSSRGVGFRHSYIISEADASGGAPSEDAEDNGQSPLVAKLPTRSPFLRQKQAESKLRLEGKGGFKTNPKKAFGLKSKKKKKKKSEPAAHKGFGAPAAEIHLIEDADPCPCGSSLSYAECCKPIHEGVRFATTPKELVRARFTAYKAELPDYLMDTTAPESEDWMDDKEKWREDVELDWERADFQSLLMGDDVVEYQDTPAQAEAGAAPCTFAKLNFNMNFAKREQSYPALWTVKEKGIFRRKDDGQWLYVGGPIECVPQDKNIKVAPIEEMLPS